MSYREKIATLAPGYDPRHVEAWMRAERRVLDHLSPEQFEQEVALAVACINHSVPATSEALARALGIAEAPFDITDGRNRYANCPGCGRDQGMGLSPRGRWPEGPYFLAVECACGFRGPEIAAAGPSSEVDRAAFEAWNEKSSLVFRPK